LITDCDARMAKAVSLGRLPKSERDHAGRTFDAPGSRLTKGLPRFCREVHPLGRPRKTRGTQEQDAADGEPLAANGTRNGADGRDGRALDPKPSLQNDAGKAKIAEGRSGADGREIG
jgi:hypothetical protein